MIVLLRERRVLAGSVIMRWLRRWGDLGCPGDELARAGELLGTCVAPVGEQAVVPDAVEALGQHVTFCFRDPAAALLLAHLRPASMDDG